MSWLKPSLYILALLIVVFGGALLLDQAAAILGLKKWLPNRQHIQQQVEVQYYEMWLAVEQAPPENIASSDSKEKSTR